MRVNEDAALLAAIEAHVALQHARVMAAAAKGEDLPDSFPLDPDVFEYLAPRTKVPEPLEVLIAQLAPSGVGSYRGRFRPGDEQFVVCMDSDGDLGALCVLDARFALVACARRDVEHLDWVSLEELVPFVRTL